MILPGSLDGLYAGEEQLRSEALGIIAAKESLQLHLAAVERTMDLGDALRQFVTDDEDLKVPQVLGMRIFNAFASTVKLVLSGYHQNGGLIMRDILETAFLLDLFSENHKLIKKWRFAGKDRWKEFSPAKVRKALDLRDGFTSKKRAEHYGMFSELAGHPSMNSVLMMRPERGGDAVVGPFMEKTSLEASLGEMGRLAILAGEILDRFFPTTWQEGVAVRVEFARIKSVWIARFYPKAKSSTTQRSP